MASTLGTYQETINRLLTTFGAEFSIETFKPSYVGSGEPRTEYTLSLRKKSVKLGSRADAANGPSFATALSVADKRTLAFAFFVARLNEDTRLAEKVVVLDDPVSSLDRNRRYNSIQLICDIAARCGQLLVLSHDAYFVRDLRDALASGKPAPLPFPIWTLKRAQQNYSLFQQCDIDDVCASPYYRHHRLVSDYVDGLSTVDAREVAKALRPLLEGYYHRRFPGCIPKRQMFGQIIALAVDPATTGPVKHLRPLEAELREVNGYAGRFHHDTNEHAESVQVMDAELLHYAERTLKLMYVNG